MTTETCFEMKATTSTAAILRELDGIRSVLDVLATLLDNNAAVRDYHPLARLAADARDRTDGIADMIDRAV